MARALPVILLVATLAAGCSAPEESGDFTAPRDGDAEGPYDTVGSDEGDPFTNGTGVDDGAPVGGVRP